MIRRIAAKLSKWPTLEGELKRWKFWWEIRRGAFVSPEPEFRALADSVLSPGDVAIDVGANFGQYTLDFARAVGPTGRVVAFEPIPETFEHLAGNTRELRNVTLLNFAASDACGFVAMNVPKWDDNALAEKNFYRASVSEDGPYKVMSVTLDTLNLPAVRLIKIDVEGHEIAVLRGAEKLIDRCHPVLMIEMPDAEIRTWVEAHGYKFLPVAPGSPNSVAMPIWLTSC